MLNSFIKNIKKRFPIAIIAIWMDFRVCNVKLVVAKESEIESIDQKSFKCYGNEIPIDAQRVIFDYQEKYRFCYVSTMYKGSNQGAFPVVSKKEYSKYGVNLEDLNIVQIDNRWSFFAYGVDILSTKQRYEKSGGIDYIFSPFFLIYTFFKDRFSNSPKLYILIQKSSVAITVFEESSLKYASFFILETDTEIIKEDEPIEESKDIEERKDSKKEDDKKESTESSTDLDELVSLDEEFEDIGELEELSDDENIEEFQEESPKEIDKRDKESDFDELNRGLNIASFIKSSLNEFYRSDVYDSSFVNEVVVADSIGVSEQVFDYIRDELLMELEVCKIDILDELCKLVKSEVDSAKL